jgi:hypothetical protein
MLEALSHRLSIAVGPQRVALVLHEGWWRKRSTLLGLQDTEGSTQDLAEIVRHIETLLTAASLAHLPTRIVLADALVRTWRVEPPRNATRAQDLMAAAAMRFTSIYEDSLDDWVLTSTPSATLAFMACAVRRSLVDDIGRVVGTHKLYLTSMEPEFVALWNHWRLQLRRGSWLGIFKDAALLLGISEGDCLVTVRRLPVPASSDGVWLKETLRREADRLNLARPVTIGLCGNSPSAWLAQDSSDMVCQMLGQKNDALSLFGVAA